MESSQLIKNLTLHQRYWTIKVLLTEKDNVRKFKAGEGKIQKVTLMDREGSKIHAIMFNETIDKFASVLKIGNTYIISNGQIKETNKNFYNVNENIEIILNNFTEISMTVDDNISSVISNLSTFEDIKATPNLPADIILLVTNVYEPRTVYRQRDKKRIVKRDLQVIGLRSDLFIFTLWESLASIEGKQLEDLKNDRPIILAKSVVGKNFNGFTLSTTSSTIIEINPDMPTSKEILDWYNEYTLSTPSIVEGYIFTKLLQINSCEHSSGEIKYYDTNVTIKGIKQEANLWYNACTICKSKVIINEEKVECLKCSKNDVGYSLRYLIKLDVEDESSTANFTVFDDEAECLIGMSVTDLHNLQASNTVEYNKFITNICDSKRIFSIKAQDKIYGNRSIRSLTVQSVKKEFDAFDYSGVKKIKLEKDLEI